MRMMRPPAVAIALVAVLCTSAASAAEKKGKPFVVVYKNDAKVELRDFEIGVEESTLFGSSYTRLKALPVKTDRLHLKVLVEKLAEIEFLSVDNEGGEIKVRLTATDGKTIEGAIDSKKDII